MFCLDCGEQLPDHASFCLKCGKPQKEDVKVRMPKWETCEIKYKIVKERVDKVFSKTPAQARFVAAAIGPNGSYEAGESTGTFGLGGWYGGMEPPYSVRVENSAAQDACRALIDQLTKDGWEPVGRRSDDWFSEGFRRQVE